MAAAIVKQLTNPYGICLAELKANREDFRRFAPHSHETLNLTGIKSGRIFVEFFDEAPQILSPGALAYFHPGRVHRTWAEAPVEYLSLHLDREWFDAFMGLGEPSTGLELSFPSIIEDTRLYQSFWDLAGVILEANRGAETTIGLAKFLRSFQMHGYLKRKRSNEPKLLQRLDALLEEEREWDCSGLAQRLGYSTAHVSRLLKSHRGLSLHAWLIDRKIRKAKRLLTTDSMTHRNLAAIAQESGFYDQSHFVKTFQRAYSLSPGKYRRDPMKISPLI